MSEDKNATMLLFVEIEIERPHQQWHHVILVGNIIWESKKGEKGQRSEGKGRTAIRE